MNGQTVTVMIRKSARGSKIKKHVTAHTFRHSFACALIRNGADITAVQKMLGHASLKTTEGYLRMVGVAVKKEHKKSHPREQDREGAETIKPSITRKKAKYEYKRHKRKTD
jgi:site-specific recombinase XerD